MYNRWTTYHTCTCGSKHSGYMLAILNISIYHSQEKSSTKDETIDWSTKDELTYPFFLPCAQLRKGGGCHDVELAVVEDEKELCTRYAEITSIQLWKDLQSERPHFHLPNIASSIINPRMILDGINNRGFWYLLCLLFFLMAIENQTAKVDGLHLRLLASFF